ncbi:MAG: hypothetical protein C5B50_21065 [Verrucomicrobia bacterium]|nr:MAG: hypothetical protein C5B50_21065 [Verrucomicrobiota bacterium]
MNFGLWTLDFGLWTLDFGLPPISQPRPSTDIENVKMAQKAGLSHVPRPPSDFGQKGRSQTQGGAVVSSFSDRIREASDFFSS